MSTRKSAMEDREEDIRRDWEPESYDCTERVARYKAWFPFLDGATGPEADAAQRLRERQYNQLAIDYYDLVSPSYERHWGQHFHYCPRIPGLSINENLVEYEVLVGKLTGLKAGMRVLDVGCGIGGNARTMATRLECKVVGLVNTPWHVERGRQLNQEAGLEDMIEMVQGDFDHLPFEDDSFDAAYAFECICYAPDVTIPFREIRRVLKPNAMFGHTNWVMTEKFDPSIEKHRVIRDQIERGNGISRIPRISDVRDGLEQCGFVNVSEEDMAGRSEPCPWYYYLTGQVRYATCMEDFFQIFMRERRVVMPIVEFVLPADGKVESRAKGLHGCLRNPQDLHKEHGGWGRRGHFLAFGCDHVEECEIAPSTDSLYGLFLSKSLVLVMVIDFLS